MDSLLLLLLLSQPEMNALVRLIIFDVVVTLNIITRNPNCKPHLRIQDILLFLPLRQYVKNLCAISCQIISKNPSRSLFPYKFVWIMDYVICKKH